MIAMGNMEVHVPGGCAHCPWGCSVGGHPPCWVVNSDLAVLTSATVFCDTKMTVCYLHLTSRVRKMEKYGKSEGS